MALSVTTVAKTELLTTRARVTEAIPGTVAGDGAFLDSLICRASAAIKSYCHRPFGREVYSETLAGFGSIELQLARTPLVGSPSTVSLDTSVITDYSVQSAEQAVLYRQLGWGWTAQVYEGLTGTWTWLDRGTPLPRQEEPRYSVAYTAGYILPPENLINSTTISASSADNSFNDSAAGFPALLKAGDVIEASQFTNSGNNGRFVVTGTPTTSKVIVAGTLTTEAAGSARTVIVQSLPTDVEAAAIECVKTWFATRATPSNIVEKAVGLMRVRYGEAGAADDMSLPPACVGLLRPWVRVR